MHASRFDSPHPGHLPAGGRGELIIVGYAKATLARLPGEGREGESPKAGQGELATGTCISKSGYGRGMDARRGLFDEFAIAMAVLTRLPVGTDAQDEPGAIAASGWAFPLVGAGIGGVVALAFFIAEALGCAALVAAGLGVLCGIALTGAFHEDGLADTADGFGGGRDRETKLAIMRDSRQGSFGVLALVFSIGLRAAALAAIGDPIHAGLALLAAHTASRGALPLIMSLMIPARNDGLGFTAGRPSRSVVLMAMAVGIAIALAALGPARGGVALILGGAGIALAATLARRQIGGYTGDVLGAFQQIGEIVMLLVAAAK
jgi:adenosylcobinamide-GDP ribazoletransferase